MNLKRYDRQIIELLQQDARLSSARVASLIGMPARSVRQRIHKMIASGVIKSVAIVNPEAFDYNIVVDIFCQVEPTRREQVVDALKVIPEITYTAFSTGDQDIVLQARFKSSADMNEFIANRLYHIPGLGRTRTVLVPAILKETYQWLPPPEAFNS